MIRMLLFCDDHDELAAAMRRIARMFPGVGSHGGPRLTQEGQWRSTITWDMDAEPVAYGSSNLATRVEGEQVTLRYERQALTLPRAEIPHLLRLAQQLSAEPPAAPESPAARPPPRRRQ